MLPSPEESRKHDFFSCIMQQTVMFLLFLQHELHSFDLCPSIFPLVIHYIFTMLQMLLRGRTHRRPSEKNHASDSVSIKLPSKQTKCPTFCSDDASFYSCYSCLWILGVLSGPAGLVLLLNLKTNPTFCILVTQRINRHRLFPSCDESGKPSGL